MIYSRILKISILCLCFYPALAQKKGEFRSFHFTSPHTSFPDTGRINGYVYDKLLYPASLHYSDSAVLLIAPEHLNAVHRVDLVFWFHGWHNNIDTAAAFYRLTSQFIASGSAAVLVLAETARDAPDSYGGKLEQPGMFKELLNDVMNELRKKGVVSDKAVAGNILLAGHSGAFRVIAYILENGGVQVQEVFLFDALYGQTDKYLDWINQDSTHHFIHWFTNKGGGTDVVSDSVMQRLRDRHVAYRLAEEENLTADIIKNNRILFVHSPREHNVIINNPDDFRLLLENSFSLHPLSAGRSADRQ